MQDFTHPLIVCNTYCLISLSTVLLTNAWCVANDTQSHTQTTPLGANVVWE